MVLVSICQVAHEDRGNDLKQKLLGLTLLLYFFSAIGGPIGELLEQNAQTFEQISANFSTHQVHVIVVMSVIILGSSSCARHACDWNCVDAVKSLHCSSSMFFSEMHWTLTCLVPKARS
ncbi:hypothetical protein AKJ16_DCAP03154 [Drosera capensis]